MKNIIFPFSKSTSCIFFEKMQLFQKKQKMQKMQKKSEKHEIAENAKMQKCKKKTHAKMQNFMQIKNIMQNIQKCKNRKKNGVMV